MPTTHSSKKTLLASVFIAAIALAGCSAPEDDSSIGEAVSLDFEDTSAVSAGTVSADADAQIGSDRVLATSSSFPPDFIEDHLDADRDELSALREEWDAEQAAIAEEEERIAEEQRMAEEAEAAERQAAQDAEEQRQAEQSQQQESSSGGSSDSGSSSDSSSSDSGSSSSGSDSVSGGGSSSDSSSGSSSSGGGGGSSESSASAPTGKLDIARSVVAQHGCSSVPVRDGVHGNWGYADWENGYIGIDSSTPDSQLRRVAAHECAHFLQWWAYDGSRSAMYESLNSIHGGSGMVGLERNADCMTILWGYGTGSNQYTNSCSSAEMDAARAISGGNRAS